MSCNVLAIVPIINDGNIYFDQNCIFGHGDLGNLPCLRRNFTKLIPFMPFWAEMWWFELVGNTFWRLCLCKLTATFILAQNSTLGILLCNCGKIMDRKIPPEKGSDPFWHFA